MRLQLDVSMTGDVAVVRGRGMIVFGPEGDELYLTVLTMLKQTKNVVLLLDGIERIGSEGVGALAKLYVSARNRDGNLKLAELSATCREILHVTRVESVFEIYETKEQAVASFHPEKAASKI